MTSTRILGTLRSADGKGIVRIEDRFATGIDDLWSAITDPDRVSRWYGKVEGDPRLGGEVRIYVFASGWEGTLRIDVCEPPRRLVLTSKEDDKPDEDIIEVTLTADGDQTCLVLEHSGVPLSLVGGYGAGTQLHIEDLAAHIAGQERCDAHVRWGELHPLYDALAAELG